MLVCHCYAVTDRTIRDAVRGGARSPDAVAATCGAGAGCGGCQELVLCIVKDEHGHALGPARGLIALGNRDALHDPAPDSRSY